MKKLNLKNKYIAWGLTAFIVLLCCMIVYYFMFHGQKFLTSLSKIMEILMPVLYGLIIAYLLTPILNYFEHKIFLPLCGKMKIKESRRRAGILRGLGIFCTFLLFFLAIGGLIYMLVSEIVPSIVNIASNFDNYVDNITNWLNKLLNDNPDVQENVTMLMDRYSDELDTWINNTVLAKSSEILKAVSMGAWGSLKVVWNLLLGIIISIYAMMHKEKFCGQFKKIIYAIFELNSANIIVNNFKFTHRTFSGFISGKVLDSFLIGCLCFMGTTILKTPYAALVSVVIGVTNVIPFFGPYLGAIPTTFLIFIVDPMHPLNCLYFVIFILVLQQFDGNILGPKILGSSTGLTSFWVIFAITFFGGIWGVFGMVVGVPIFAIIYAAFRSIINTKLRKKKLPTGSSNYTFVCAVDEKGLHEYIPEYKQPKDKQKQYRFGQKFLSDFDETIDGAYMKREDQLQSDPLEQTDNVKNAETTDNTVNIENTDQPEQPEKPEQPDQSSQP